MDMLDTGNEATEGTILDGRSHIRTELRRQSYALPLNGQVLIGLTSFCSHYISQNF